MTTEMHKNKELLTKKLRSAGGTLVISGTICLSSPTDAHAVPAKSKTVEARVAAVKMVLQPDQKNIHELSEGVLAFSNWDDWRDRWQDFPNY